MAKYSNETFLERQLDRLSKQTGLFLVRLFYVPCLKKPEDRDLGVAAVAHCAVPMNLVGRSQIFPAALHVRSSAACRACLERKRTGRAHASGAQIWLGAACANLFPYWIGPDSFVAALVARISLRLRGSRRENFLKAASLCCSDYIAFCDQDDIWLREKLAVVESYLRRNHCMLLQHRFRLINHAGNVISSDLNWEEELRSAPWRHS
jgi:hypothetical protein